MKDIIFASGRLGEIKSSPNEIKSFTTSNLHHDYLNEINIRILETTSCLDDLDMKYTGRQYDMFRGRKKNLLEMKELFLGMLENKISDDSELEEGESNV